MDRKMPKRKYTKNGKLFHDNKVYYYQSKSKSSIHYRCACSGCFGRATKAIDTGEVQVTRPHNCLVSAFEERARDAAMEKLKQLTLAGENCKAIDIVRKVLRELPPNIKHLMPVEDSLRRNVGRWARQAGVLLAKSTFDDYNPAEVGEDNEQTEPGDVETNETTRKESEATRSAQVWDVDPKPCSSDDKKWGLFFLRGQKVAGHYRAMIEGQIYHWQKGGKQKAFYNCRDARIGCPVTATIYHEKEYEVHGVHFHDTSKVKCRLRGKAVKKWVLGLKRVDDEGNILGPAGINDVPHAGGDSSDFNTQVQPLRVASVSALPVSNTMDDDHDDANVLDDDFQDDFDCEPTPTFVDTSRNAKKGSTQSTERANDAVKSGERCFVCGDELIVSETLSSSTETFQKACRYLNVKFEKEYSPGRSSEFYPFCDGCTREILRIHVLYKKVEEIQSLIFKKVEIVEKRIADAEIIDNWMAEVPPFSAIRYENFRKQVLINYKNKLKLRREIRVGKKMGHGCMVEVQPVTSAHMFASNPAETDAFRKIPGTNTNALLSTARRSRGRPKSKPRQENESDFESDLREPTLFIESIPEDDINKDQFGDSQDALSDVSAKEIKFWHDDPSKLKSAENPRVSKDARMQNENEESEDDTGGNISDSYGGNESDSNFSIDKEVDDDESDEDWEQKRKTKSKAIKTNCRKRATATGKSYKGKNMSEKETKTSHSKNIEFPDAVLTKDNRVLMQGIEIIKLSPGTYTRKPDCEVFQCGACGKVCLNFWRIRQHICGLHLGMYKCHICDKQFCEPRVVEKHIETMHQERVSQPCEICGRPIYGDEKSMRYHRWTHFSEEEKNDPQFKNWCPRREREPSRVKADSLFAQTFQCFQCGKTFTRPSALRRHEVSHAVETPTVQCQYCGKFYRQGRPLAAHLKRCSGLENLNRKMYPCPRCPTRFKYRSTLSKHLRNHDKPMPFSCPRCPRKFGSKSGFRNHKRICTQNAPKSQDNIPSNRRQSTSVVESAAPVIKTDSVVSGDETFAPISSLPSTTMQYAMNYSGGEYT